MKRKDLRVLSVALVFALLLPVFALTACTDKDKDKSRELNAIEQSIVGFWTADDHPVMEFKSDGTWRYRLTEPYNSFEQNGEATMQVGEKYGHYYIIKAHGIDRFALFDDEPDKLYDLLDIGVVWHRITDEEAADRVPPHLWV